MFKLSKHIFIVFVFSIIVPLLIMFSLHHYKMTTDRDKIDTSFLDVGIIQVEESSQEYLLRQKEDISNAIKYLPKHSLKLNDYKNIFKADKAYFLNDDYQNKNPIYYNLFRSLNEPVNFYEISNRANSAKSDLVTIIFIPFEFSDNGLILIKKVMLRKICPKGPFDLEVYSGAKPDKNNLLNMLEDDFAKPDFLKHREKPPSKRPPRRDDKFNTFELRNISGEIVSTLVLKMHKPPHHPPFDKILQIIGSMIVIIGGMLSVIVGVYIKKNFINPFILISNALKKIQNGDFSSFIQYKSKHIETSETIDRFNQMLEGLKEKEELRNSFIASLTHDLRTPLIAQDRAIDYIIKEFQNLSLEEPLVLAKGLEQNNKHLLRMVNLLLESYHFDSGKINIKVSDISLFELIENSYKNLHSLAIEKNIELVNNVSKSLDCIKADESTLTRVFFNLIANSIDNISKEGKIIISVKVIGSIFEIIIEDNGPGISQEDQIHLFDKYYTGKTNERKLGSGLGLHICKQLVELNNGSISVESKMGKYTKFTILLPKE